MLIIETLKTISYEEHFESAVRWLDVLTKDKSAIEVANLFGEYKMPLGFRIRAFRAYRA